MRLCCRAQYLASKLEEKIRNVCKDVTKVVYVFDDLPGDDPYVVSLPYFKILFFSFLRNRY